MLRIRFWQHLCVPQGPTIHGILLFTKLETNCSSIRGITPSVSLVCFISLFCSFTVWLLTFRKLSFPDLLTVNETSNEPPVDDPEVQNNLALEATFVCNNFSQQVLKMVIERSVLMYYFRK